MLSVVVLACYLACAAWLASSVYRAGEHAAHGRRVAGLALGVIALVLHAILLWQGLFSRPVLSFTIAETASRPETSSDPNRRTRRAGVSPRPTWLIRKRAPTPSAQ